MQLAQQANQPTPPHWRLRVVITTLMINVFISTPIGAKPLPDDAQWTDLFNGKDLADWTIKVTGHPPGANPHNTFKVVNGVIRVDYDDYEEFGGQFGHLFHNSSWSHYALSVSYRFFGDQAKGGPRGWALRNSGVMLHAQSPQSMGLGQEFPDSIEVQFLGGLSDSKSRPTANVCTPGTHIHIDDKLIKQHCLPSESDTYDGDGWVEVVVVVLGGGSITHYVDGEEVLRYQRPVLDKQADNYNTSVHTLPALAMGQIALQSESHPVEFRWVRLLNLAGCTDANAQNFRPYFVKSEPGSCVYAKAD